MRPPRAEVLRGLLRRPRNRILLGLLVLGVSLRIALPYLLRPLIVSQADAALVGRIELADLGLSLIRGGVTLHGLEVHVDELPPPAPEGAPAPEAVPPVFEAKRLWTQISWLALLRKTIDVQEFQLEGFAVRLDRLKDGLLLPRPVPGEAPAEPETKPPLAWSFAADSVALRDGQIAFRDFTVGEEPQRLDLAVKDLSASDLALVIDAAGLEPGHVVISAQIGEGSLGLDAQVESRPAGPAVVSKITLANLPIGGVRVYLKMFGWSDLAGTLDATIEHRFETAGAHEVGGSVSLSNVVVSVPKLDRPALAWKKLGVDVEKIDLMKQHAAVSQLALEGARIVIDPRAQAPVPLITPRPGARAGAAAGKTSAPEPAAAETSKPWTWRIARVRLADAGIDLLGAAQPLPLALAAELRDVASDAGSRWPVTLSLKQGAGSFAVDGALGVSPLAFDGKLRIVDLALAPLLGRIDAPGTSWLRQGNARAELAIVLVPRGGALGGAPPTDLKVSGTFGFSGIDVGEAQTAKEFGVAWKDFEVGIRELAIPELIGARDPAKPLALAASLDRVRWVQPAFRITRTQQGILLPPLGEKETQPAEAAAAAQPETGEPAASAAPGPEIRVEVADAQIEGGRAQIVDRSVKPFYKSKIDRLDLKARGIRWPGPFVQNLVLGMRGLQGATLDVRGSIAPGNSKLEVKLVELPLAPFNPYVTASGYSLAGGTLSFDSKAKVERKGYDTSSSVVISQLDVGGAEGESLFQQNFGIPLSVALGLLKDLDGDIKLAVPVAGDRGGAKVGLRSLVGQALRKALIGALASPLKLFGAITADGKVQSLAPEPIAFLPGRAQIAEAGTARIEQLAGLLSASPGIALTLSGATAPPDVRWFQEQALLEELRATSGVRALGKLGEIGTRRAVRNYLEARFAGQDAALEPGPRDWLEAQVVRQSVDSSQLALLAAARAAAAQQALATEYGIKPERLTLGPPVSEVPTAVPGVTIALGALPRASR